MGPDHGGVRQGDERCRQLEGVPQEHREAAEPQRPARRHPGHHGEFYQPYS